MSAATLFEQSGLDGRDAARHGRRGGLLSLISGGFGASQEVPEVQRPQIRSAELGLNEYLRGVERMIERSERTQVNQTLVTVTPGEVQTLVDKAAKAKARYLAAALELADGHGLPDASTIKALDAARERHAALERSVQDLLAELRRGHIHVEGVADEPLETPDAG